MTEKMEEVLKSLLSKLSAVRVTLTDQEQALLDQLILGSPAEVAAQSFRATKPVATKPVATSPDEAAAQSIRATKPVATKPVATSPDEAAAQSIRATKPVATKPVASSPDEVLANRLLVFSEADEVSAQSIPANILNNAGFYNPVWVKIMYDPEMECYVIQ
jgi:hypothetical protein